jgi:hypothetical protein
MRYYCLMQFITAEIVPAFQLIVSHWVKMLFVVLGACAEYRYFLLKVPLEIFKGTFEILNIGMKRTYPTLQTATLPIIYKRLVFFSTYADSVRLTLYVNLVA